MPSSAWQYQLSAEDVGRDSYEMCRWQLFASKRLQNEAARGKMTVSLEPLEAPLQFDSPRRADDKIETGMP